MKNLKRFWFTFRTSPKPTMLNLGCGITAYNYDDAMTLLRERVFVGAEPDVVGYEEDVDVSKLDKNHVLPNMGSVVVRGIWFPLGYDEIY
jgi:hypothetical protein